MGYYIKGTSVLSIFDPKDQLRRRPLLFYTSEFAMIRDVTTIP